MSEILARLNPSVAQIGEVTGGTGEVLQASDVAAALKGIPDEICNLMLYKDAGLEGFKHPLVKAYSAKLERLGRQKGWTEPKDNFYKNAVEIAIEEFCGIRCNKCKGRGHHPDPETKRTVECIKCGGSGNGKIKDSVKARRLGIARQSYGQTWLNRWYEIERLITADYSDGEYILKINLKY